MTFYETDLIDVLVRVIWILYLMCGCSKMRTSKLPVAGFWCYINQNCMEHCNLRIFIFFCLKKCYSIICTLLWLFHWRLLRQRLLLYAIYYTSGVSHRSHKSWDIEDIALVDKPWLPGDACTFYIYKSETKIFGHLKWGTVLLF